MRLVAQSDHQVYRIDGFGDLMVLYCECGAVSHPMDVTHKGDWSCPMKEAFDEVERNWAAVHQLRATQEMNARG